MRWRLGLIFCSWTLVATAAVGIADAAGGEGPVSILLPETELSVESGFSPKALATRERTPILLRIGGEIKRLYGGTPPALRELTVEFDKAIEIDTEGIPACKRSELGETVEILTARELCGSALIGEGEVTVQVHHPEGDLVNIPSKLLVFKGGEKDGKTTLFIYGYFSNPIFAAMVTRVTIAKHELGRFGTRAIAKIPQFAQGAGSITDFDLEIFKEVEVDGESYDPISARCSDGKLKIHFRGDFEDGTRMETETIRACTPRS